MGRDRTHVRAGIAVTCLLVAMVILPVQGAGAADPTGPGSIVFGVHPTPVTQGEVTAIEQSIVRQFSAVRVFDRWNSQFPTAFDLWLRDTDRTPIFSIATRFGNGTPVTWRSIADSAPGSAVYDMLVSWARRIRDYGAPIYMLFSPEPEGARSADLGTNVDYIDAWRKFYDVFHAEGVTNATYVWTMTDEAFWITGRNAAANWYPGDAYVDAIGADAYNWANCKTAFPNGPWKSFFQIVNPMRLFGQHHPTKPLMLPEFGTVEDPANPTRKAQWFVDAMNLLASPGWESFRLISNFNQVDWANPGCNFRVDSSAASLAAYAAMGAHPHFAGNAAPSPSPTPSPDTTPPTVPGKPTGTSPSAGTITISWAASTDASPPITYRIYRDGGSSPIGQTTNTTFTDPGLTGGTSHTYEVDAVDSATPTTNTSSKSPASDPIVVQSGSSAIFTDDFTSGGFTNWNSATRLTIDNSTGSPAAPSARAQVTGQSAFALKTLSGTFNQVCMSVSVNVANGGGNVIDLLRVRTAANGPVAKVFLNASGILYFRNDVGGNQQSSGTALGTGWHEIELCGTVGVGTTWYLYRDGVRIINGATVNTGTTAVGLIQIGDNAARTMTVRFDNVRLDQVPGV